MAQAAPAVQHAWPKLVGDHSRVECRQAFRLATRAFQSPRFALQGPFDPIPDLGSVFSVYRSETDLSGGNGLASDGGAFETITLPGNGRFVFWQREVRDGVRLAVLESPFGWRGDVYTTVVAPASASRGAVIEDAAREDPGKAVFKLLFGGSRWNPPLILTHRASGAHWIIDSGEISEALADWRVFTLDGGVARSPCAIAFRPPVKATVSLTPPAVRRWAARLDDALGPGADEGTLHPTARIRGSVASAWANAAARPWAVAAVGYNTADEVDAGLKAWAAGSKARTKVYRAIREEYGPAQGAMAAYYARAFGLKPAEASAAGRYVIDAMYRQYFFFHREGDEVKDGGNPWPSRVR